MKTKEHIKSFKIVKLLLTLVFKYNTRIGMYNIGDGGKNSAV